MTIEAITPQKGTRRLWSRPAPIMLLILGGGGGSACAAIFTLILTVPPSIVGANQQPSTAATDVAIVGFALIVSIIVGGIIGLGASGFGILLRMVARAVSGSISMQAVAVGIGAFAGAFVLSLLLVPLFIPWNSTVFASAVGGLASVILALATVVQAKRIATAG